MGLSLGVKITSLKRGVTDLPLTERGVEQVKATAAKLVGDGRKCLITARRS